MKLKHIYLPLFSLGLLLNLTSCDESSDSVNELELSLEERDQLTAKSLSQLSVGDTVFYVTSDNTVPTLGNLTFDANLRATIGRQLYDYVKIDKYLFTITRTSAEDIFTLFTRALDNTLTDNGTNSQLGSRLRELLHREDPIFTTAELVEISAILAPSGTSTSVADDGTLITHLDGEYTHLVTSNKLQQSRGTMAGTYFLNSNSLDIGFRRPSDAEIAKYRFITFNDDWMPYVTGRRRPLERIEAGTWSLELHNSPN